MSTSTDDGGRFDELYRATRKDVLAYLIRRTGDPEQAADMLADTYLIAWRRLAHIPDGHQGRLWLFGVARNLLLKGAERRRSQDVLVERLASELQITFSASAPADDHRANALREGVAGLPDKEREVLLLTAWEGLTPREIAAVTGTSANLVRVRLAHARTKLRRRLACLQPPAGSPRPATMKTDT
jgi:RNA polymerase sigma-70 factor (ECF subfamily)